MAYPSTLPVPRSAPLTPAERRLMSELPGPRQTRGIERDPRAGQDLEWIFTFEQMETWTAWLAEISDGGAWWSADWPMPIGGAGQRRFVGAPSEPVFIARVGFTVRAHVELRGRAAPLQEGLPCDAATAALASAVIDAAYIVATYIHGFDDGATNEGTYFAWSDGGSAAPPFPFPISIDWSSLHDAPGVTVLIGDRAGATDTSMTLTVNGPLTDGCRPVVFITGGTWTSVEINLPGSDPFPARKYHDPEIDTTGPGYWMSFFYVNVSGGVVTGVEHALPVAQSGWMDSVHDSASAAQRSNTGTDNFGSGITGSEYFYGRILNWNPGDAGVPGWRVIWEPVAAENRPSVSFSGISPNVETHLTFASFDTGFFHAPEGLLTFVPTIDGFDGDAGIELSIGPGDYNPLAWGPVT